MFKRLRWQLLVTLAGLFVVAGLLVNLAHRQSMTVLAGLGRVYTEGLAGHVQYVNPLLWTTNAEQDLVSLIFSGLARTDESGQVVPDLAKEWTIMDDGLTYVFTLRENARWHDGTPVTADDVVYTISLLQDESQELLREQAALWRSITVDKLDDRTVRFSLSEPLAPFLDYATLPLLPAHRLQGVTAQGLAQASFNQAPIGTGPYRLIALDQEHATLVAFEDFYGPEPYLREVTFRFYPDVQSALMAYQRGEIDGISRLFSLSLTEASELRDLAIYSAQQASCVALILNLDKQMFHDVRVRRALLMATDRQRLIDAYAAGQGIIANSPVFPGSWAYDPETQRIPYDIEGARALLREAGWSDSDGDGRLDLDGERLEIEILTNDDPTRRAMAQAIAEQWSQIGVLASVLTTNIATLRMQYLQPRNFDAILYGWSQTMADPDPYSLWHSSQIETGQNYAGLRSRAIDEVLEAGRRTTDVAERQRLYADFQKLFIEEMPALLLYYPVYHYAVDSRVQNVQLPHVVFRPSDRFYTLYRWYVQPAEELNRLEFLPLSQLWNVNDGRRRSPSGPY